MKRQARIERNEGFTIVETMIVLAVTGAMFVVAMLAFGGQQEKTRFSQATRDVESKLQDIANDVSAGYFAETSGWQCSAGASNTPPSVSQLASDTGGQGTNEGCIFIGKVVQFGVNDADCADNCTGLRIATMVGNRQITQPTGRREVRTIDEANPGVPPEDSPYVEPYTIPYGLGVYRVLRDDGRQISGVGFLSSLSDSDADNNPVAGSQTVGLYAMAGNGSLGLTPNEFNVIAEGVSDGVGGSDRITEATICLRSDQNGGRLAAIVLREQASGISTNLIVDGVPGGCL